MPETVADIYERDPRGFAALVRRAGGGKAFARQHNFGEGAVHKYVFASEELDRLSGDMEELDDEARYVRFDNELDAEELEAYYIAKTSREERVAVVKLTPLPGEDYAHHVYISDVHAGHCDSDIKRFFDLMDWIEASPITYSILGDIFNFPTRSSPGGTEDDILTYTQVKPMIEKRVKATRKKCKGIHDGNHEFRLRKLLGVDLAPGKELADKYGIPYLGYEARVQYQVGDQTYEAYQHHGRGAGSRTEAGKLKAVEEMLRIHTDCDLAVMGHNHGLAAQPTTAVVNDGGTLRVRRRMAGLSGGFLRYMGGNYARIAAYPASVLGALGVYFYANHHSLHGRV